jgi:uncharacterized membrane protein YqaE (UPF0057 family)
MLFLVAVVCPPLAVLYVEGPLRAAVCVVLTCLLFVPGMLHALAVVARHRNDLRNEALLQAVANYDSGMLAYAGR